MKTPRKSQPISSLIAKEREAAYRVFEVSDELLGSASPDGYFTALNPAWERTLGFPREALMGQPFVEFVHPGDREATLAETRRLVSDGTPSVEFQNRYAVKSGGWCWLSWQAAMRPEGLFFVARDVTAHVAAEQRRRMQEHLVEGIDDAILTKTTDGVITSWNQAAESLYGYSAAEAIGKPMVDLIVPEDRSDEVGTIVSRLLAGDGIRQYTTKRRRSDGTLLTVSLTASLLRDEEHKVLGVAVVTRDISELSPEDTQVRGEIDTLAWVGRIRDAIDEGRMGFHAQPIVSLAGGPTAFELLCRMTSPDGELIMPALFLPVAENYGLVSEIDLLAVDEAARLIAQGHEMCINLSTATVARRHIVDVIAEKLSTAGADPARLTIEITETALMKDIAAAQRFAVGVARLGCRLALDDFGTGFGGFTYLKKLRIDRLKIDIEFVRDLRDSRASRQVVKAVVSLAKGLGLDTVAEGVEDEPTSALLEELGVTHLQGYLFTRPAPIDELLAGWGADQPSTRRSPSQ
jgi:PAS domain S-box-containing protein